MALTTCPDCGAQASDSAWFCPKCGNPLNSDSPAQFALGIGVLLVVTALAMWLGVC